VSSPYTTDIEGARTVALALFDKYGVDATTEVELVYSMYSGATGAIAYASEMASQLGSYLEGETDDPGYEAWQTGKFWAGLAYWYSDTFGVSDTVSDVLDAAAHGSSPAVQVQAQGKVTPKDVVAAVEQTGTDLANVAKKGVSFVPLAIGLAVVILITGKGR